MRNSNLTRWIFVSALLVALAFVPAMAQAYKANLYVTVVTEDGNPSVDATVILTGRTGARTVQTDKKGLARFANLEPGTYNAEVSQEGYNTAIHEGLQLTTGSNASIEVVLQRSELVETVKVTSVTPLMDRRKVGTATVITPDEMEKVPTARDPWAVMNTVPGIQTDRINVGGNQSGQQSGFAGKGDNGDNATWVMDGVEFGDLAAEGGSSTYFDFNSFQEIGFTTGGGDLEQLSPGQRMTFVTKQGANRNTGSIGMVFADQGMQGDQSHPLNPDGSVVNGNKMNEFFEKNFELGGPIVKDKAWYWVGFTQNDIDLRVPGSGSTELTDRTKLRNKTVKINGTIGGEANYKLFYTNGDKIKIGRNAGPDRPQPTTWDQSGPTPITTADFSYFFNPNLEVSAQISHVGGGFQLIPQGTADQMVWDSNFVWQDTFVGYITDRPQDQYAVRGNWFVDGENTSHEFKFGFKYKTGEVQSFSTYGTDGVVAVEWAGEAWLYRGGTAKEDLNYSSLWAGDTILWNNWTFNVGALYMSQDGNQLASTGSANGLCPTCMGDLTFSGVDPGFDWTDVLPRVAATYTFDTDRRQLVRASYSEYADELHVSEVSFNHPMNTAEIDYDWTDDGDGVVQVGELDLVNPLWWGNVDPNNPNAIGAPIDRIDTGLEAPTVDEFIVGYEIELAKDFTLGVNYTNRTRDNTTWAPVMDVNGGVLPSSAFAQASLVNGTIDCFDNAGPCNLPSGTPYTVQSYNLTAAGAAMVDPNYGSLLTNRSGYSEDFESWEITATKRLSNKWALRGFLAFQDWTRNVGAAGIQNPANLVGGTTQDGSDVVVGAGTSSGAFGDVFIGTASWQYNVNAIYQLPRNFTVSANLNGRQGYVLPLYHRVDEVDANGSLWRQNLQVLNVDSVRLDDITVLDLKLGYLIQMSGDTTVDLSLEVFNALDDDTIMQLERRMNATNGGRIDEVLSPRLFRLGARVTF